MRNSNAFDQIVVSGEEVLTMWIVEISSYDTAPSDENEIFAVRM